MTWHWGLLLLASHINTITSVFTMSTDQLAQQAVEVFHAGFPLLSYISAATYLLGQSQQRGKDFNTDNSQDILGEIYAATLYASWGSY